VEASGQAEVVGACVRHDDYTKANNYGSAKTLDHAFRSFLIKGNRLKTGDICKEKSRRTGKRKAIIE
jgi:hypothetical protein